ncbi:MAG: MGMT family protein, partial [Paracoccaceae bacterium]|nr:MGMT family protein [Paracoccaceae bacterium]
MIRVVRWAGWAQSCWLATLTADTGLGVFSIEETDGAITALHWRAAKMDEETPLLVEARRQLIAYAQGDLTEFDLPLVPEGGPLQQAVLAEMRAIPFGETKTYGEIAKIVGAPAQAVGQACGANT